MKNSKSILLLALTAVSLIVLLASCQTTGTGAGKEPTVVTLNGSGTVYLEADMVKFSINVNEQAETTGEAQQKTNKKMTQILDLLKKHNIESKDITTTALNFSTDYYWEDGKQIKAGESVSQTVYVTMKNIAEFAALADDIGTQLTGISFYNVSFDSTQKVVAGNTARELAYQNAFEKASLYAKQAGLEVIRPISISEGYASFATANYKRAYAEDAVATMAAAPVPETYGTQMPTGLLSASVDVNITFELK